MRKRVHVPIKSPISDLVQLLFSKDEETKAWGMGVGGGSSGGGGGWRRVCVSPEVTQQDSGKAMLSPATDLGSAQGWLWFQGPNGLSASQLPARSVPVPSSGSLRLKGGRAGAAGAAGEAGSPVKTRDAGQGAVPAVCTAQLLRG